MSLSLLLSTIVRIVGIDIAGQLTTWGPLGLVVLLLVTGVLVPGYVHRKLEKRCEDLEEALKLERQRNADLQQFAATGQNALAALAQVAEERRRTELAISSGPGHPGDEQQHGATIGGGR